MTTTQQQNKEENIILLHEKNVQGPITELFHSYTTIKIAEFLITSIGSDYSKRDIARNSGVSFRHTLKAIKLLETAEIIKKTRNVGKAQMYTYNTENDTAKTLHNFWLSLACDRSQRRETNQKPGDPITLIM